MSKSVQWLSPVPDRCETCEAPIKSVFYDAKTTMGPWACMCPSCFTFGPGINKLGLGLGQKYTKRSNGKWVKQE